MGLRNPRTEAEGRGGFNMNLPGNEPKRAADEWPTDRIATRDGRSATRSSGSRILQSLTTWSFQILVLLLASQPGSCARANLLSHENNENYYPTESVYDVQNTTKANENLTGQALEGEQPRSRLTKNDDMSLNALDEPELPGEEVGHLFACAVLHAESVENSLMKAYDERANSPSKYEQPRSRLTENDDMSLDALDEPELPGEELGHFCATAAITAAIVVAIAAIIAAAVVATIATAAHAFLNPRASTRGKRMQNTKSFYLSLFCLLQCWESFYLSFFGLLIYGEMQAEGDPEDEKDKEDKETTIRIIPWYEKAASMGPEYQFLTHFEHIPTEVTDEMLLKAHTMGSQAAADNDYHTYELGMHRRFIESVMRRGPVQPEERRPIKRRSTTPTAASSPKSTRGVDRGWGEGAPQACLALWRAQGPK
jgi:hypothetical protein